MKYHDISGQTFGMLKVLSKAERGARKNGRAMWNCLCKCGKSTLVGADSLKSGKTASCGCLAIEKTSERFTKHGHNKGYTTSREYTAWVNMRQRCSDKNAKSWPNYGGRGITVFPEWQNSFASFFEHVGHSPGSGFELDRIDNDEGYKPGNVRWVTKAENNMNKRPRRKEVIQ